MRVAGITLLVLAGLIANARAENVAALVEKCIGPDPQIAIPACNELYDSVADIRYVTVALMGRDTAYVEAGELDKGIADLTKAIDIGAGDGGVFYIRAVAYIRKADFDKALADLNGALSTRAGISTAK